MTLKDVCLFLGGITVGCSIIAVAVKTSVNKIKKEIKKEEREILDETKDTIRKEIVEEIKNDIQYKNIVDDIKTNIVCDVTEDYKENMNKFIKTINAEIYKFDERLTKAENDTLDVDKRIGKMVTSIASKIINIRGGATYVD